MGIFDNSHRDTRARRILAEVKGKRVVHIGCADAPFTAERLANGTLLHTQILMNAPETLGVDIDTDAMQLIAAHAPQAKLFSPESVPSYNEFLADIIVAGEVIEHIVDFALFGSLLRKVSGPESVVIVTTPNAYSLKGTLRALVGTEEQHPDHKCLFSPATLQVMMTGLGFQLLSRSYYNNPPRSLFSAPLGYGLNMFLSATPRASDGLYFKFRKQQ